MRKSLGEKISSMAYPPALLGSPHPTMAKVGVGRVWASTPGPGGQFALRFLKQQCLQQPLWISTGQGPVNFHRPGGPTRRLTPLERELLAKFRPWEGKGRAASAGFDGVMGLQGGKEK